MFEIGTVQMVRIPHSHQEAAAIYYWSAEASSKLEVHWQI